MVAAWQGFEEANVQLSNLASQKGHQIPDFGHPTQDTYLIWQPHEAHLLTWILRHKDRMEVFGAILERLNLPQLI